MSLDPLLLSRLRDAGLSDGYIRHLHDAALGPTSTISVGAIDAMIDATQAAINVAGHSITSCVRLAEGVHWTGSAVRLAGQSAIPETVIATLPGKPLSSVIDTPGVASKRIETVDNLTTNATLIHVDTDPVPPASSRIRQQVHRAKLLAGIARQRGIELSFEAVAFNFVCMMVIGVIIPVLLERLMPGGTILGVRLSLLLAICGCAILAMPRLGSRSAFEAKVYARRVFMEIDHRWS